MKDGPGRSPHPASARAVAPPRDGGLYRIRVREIWSFLLKQPASFWLICGYLFMEYVRPQSIYEPLMDLPLAEVALLLAVGALIVEGKVRRSYNSADVGLAVFAGIVFVSIAFSYYPEVAVAQLNLFVGWLLVYFLVTNLVDTENRFLVFMLSFLLYSLKMSQHATRSWIAAGFGFRDWGVTGAPGFFQNSGEFAIQMTIFIPLSVYFIIALKKYWPTWKVAVMCLLPVTAVLGILASSSRGGQLGLAAVIVLMAAKSRRKSKALLAVALVGIGAFLLLPEQQKDRFSSIGEDTTSELRLTYWQHAREITAEHPAIGIGYKNWLPYYRARYNPIGEVQHSIYYEASTELGITGLLAFLFLAGVTFRLNHRTRRLARKCRGDPAFLVCMAHGLDAALVGFLVSGAFVTVLYYPFFWINLAMSSALHTVARQKADRRVKSVRAHPAALAGRTPAAWRAPAALERAPRAPGSG